MLRDSLTPYKLCCYIIKKFVKSKNIAWGYEINQAKKLLKFESKDTFWFKIKSKELNSLEWLLSFEGKKYLLKQKQLLNLDKKIKKTYTLEDDKIGHDKKITKKIKTLKEFLNGKT